MHVENLRSEAWGWLGTHINRWSLVSLKQELYQKLYYMKIGMSGLLRKNGHKSERENDCQRLSYIRDLKAHSIAEPVRIYLPVYVI